MRLVTSLLTLAAAAAASPLLSQQDDSGRVWLNTLPSNVTFECRGRIPGYYADVESGCQMYHMCDPQSRRYSYLCPAYTEFSQFYMTCVQHDRVNCSMSESFFHMNEMIGQPRTRFHDLRQHDHSKKKDTEGSKATNQVDASEPAGHVLFEFETKMDVKLEKVERSRQPERTREGSAGRGDAVDSHRANERRLPATRAPPRVPQPHRLFKTLSPPRDSESATEPSSARPSTRRVRPRARFSAFAGNTATTPASEKTDEEAEEDEEAPSSEEVPALPLPRNTYRTFGLPGSFSFGTLLMRDNKPDTTSTPEPVARAPWATAAPPTSVKTTDMSSTEATTRATTTRDRSNTASHVFGTSSATTEAAKTENNVTTTSRPSHTRPRARLTTEAETATTARTSARSNTESTPTRSATTPVTTPKPTTTPTTTQRSTTERTTAAPTTTETTTAKATTPDRWSRRTTEATTTETTTRSTTTEPTTTKRTTTASTTLPTRSDPRSTSRTSPTPSPSTALPSVPPSPAVTRRPLHSAPPVPTLLGKELPPIEELEALRLSFTLDPPKLAVKADGPHEERNMKVRGELITGEMALRKLMVDQLKPVYFPNPSLPLNLLPPLLSEQAEEDGGQTTTLTLPVRRQRPDALLQAAAVAFNILPPELASLVPPLLTPPPPPLPSTGATTATSTADSESHHEKPTKDRSNLTMKFGKKKTRFRDGDSHGSPNDACYPCMKSFVKDLDRCHPCVIIR